MARQTKPPSANNQTRQGTGALGFEVHLLLTHLVADPFESAAKPGQGGLLENMPILRHSIDRRNPFVDPLSFIQIELPRRRRDYLHDAVLRARCSCR